MDAPLLDDPRFLRALRSGDERAFVHLVRRTQDRVFNVCVRLLGCREEAREVAQEVYVTLYRKIGQFRGDAKLSTWIYRVASNHAKNRIKYLSRRGDRRSDSFDDLEVPPSEGRLSAAIPRPDQVLEGARLQALIERALASLDPDQREVVVLRDIEGLTYEDIAEVTGLNIGTVKSRLHRGRVRLKDAVERWRFGPIEGRAQSEATPADRASISPVRLVGEEAA